MVLFEFERKMDPFLLDDTLFDTTSVVQTTYDFKQKLLTIGDQIKRDFNFDWKIVHKGSRLFMLVFVTTTSDRYTIYRFTSTYPGLMAVRNCTGRTHDYSCDVCGRVVYEKFNDCKISCGVADVDDIKHPFCYKPAGFMVDMFDNNRYSSGGKACVFKRNYMKTQAVRLAYDANSFGKKQYQRLVYQRNSINWQAVNFIQHNKKQLLFDLLPKDVLKIILNIVSQR